MTVPSMLTATPFSRHERIQVASLAGCDPRCIQFYEQGKPMRSTTIARVTAALRTLGWLDRANATRETTRKDVAA